MIPLEVWIVVFAGTFVLPFASLHRVVRESNPLVETVHIQLSDEGCIIVVLEQLRDQGLSKLILVQDNKRIASF